MKISTKGFSEYDIRGIGMLKIGKNSHFMLY